MRGDICTKRTWGIVCAKVGNFVERRGLKFREEIVSAEESVVAGYLSVVLARRLKEQTTRSRSINKVRDASSYLGGGVL